MMPRTETSFCRICAGCCGVQMKIDDNQRITDVRGDKNNPMTKGYVCFMGLQVEDTHHSLARILQPQKRQPDGSFAPIPSEQAFDEIAARMRSIIDRDGPDSIGLFVGNAGTLNSSAQAMQRSFLSSLGSSQYYSTVTIDQSAKLVSFERMGGWAAGLPGVEQSDVALLFGTNPLLSHATVGFLVVDPARRLKRAKERGMKLIVVDPRFTETAKQADIFVQPIPGQDAAIAAGLLRIILREGWHDEAFCARHVGEEGLAALRTAVEPFTAEMVAARAGIEEAQLHAVARMFARDNKRGQACSATGANMAPFSNVAQHLIDCLNVVCGKVRRAGDSIAVNLLSPEMPVRAEVIPPPRSWEGKKASRIRGVAGLFGEKMSGTLADEILTPGRGQIKALIVDGANPANSMPDQQLMVKALRELELLVSIEPYMTATARCSHYILPPKLQYERADLPLSVPGYAIVPDNWAQYAPALLRPPTGSDVIDDWYFFWSVAKRLGLEIVYDGKVELDMENPPTTDELLAIRLRGARVSLDELKRHPSGKMFDLPSAVVQPGSDSGARFEVMPGDVAAELRQFLEARTYTRDAKIQPPRAFLLSSRRLRDVNCSLGTHLEQYLARTPGNPAFIHPLDLDQLGIQSGDRVQVISDAGQIAATVQADETMKRGVISLSHGWGGLPDDDQENGSCVNRLIDCRKAEEVNAMPWMSAIPVDIVPLSGAAH